MAETLPAGSTTGDGMRCEDEDEGEGEGLAYSYQRGGIGSIASWADHPKDSATGGGTLASERAGASVGRPSRAKAFWATSACVISATS